MPLSDPNTLTTADWVQIQEWLRMMWIFFPLIIVFAFSMMIAHAFIPSGIDTGQFPPATRLLRLPLTLIGLLALAGALYFIVQAVFFLPGVLENFWPRFWV
jgi:hypothetical protein